MSLLKALRQSFTDRHQDKQIDMEAEHWRLAELAAAGKEISPEEFDRVYHPGTRIKVQCPVGESHTHSRITRTGDNGVAACVCDDCGHTWKQNVELTPVPFGAKTFDDFEEAVRVVQQRQAYREQFAKLPKAVEDEQRLTSQRQEAIDAFNAAVKTRDEVLRATESPLATAAMVRQRAEAARDQLLRQCYKPDLIAARDALARELKSNGHVASRLKRDLWGYGDPGRLDSVEQGTTGSECFTHIQKLASYDGMIAEAIERRPGALERDAWLDPKFQKDFAAWFAPTSPEFHQEVMGRKGKGTPADRARYQRDLKRYVAFWDATMQPLIARWIEATNAEHELSEKIEALQLRMIEA